jgi:hypothetical protein
MTPDVWEVTVDRITVHGAGRLAEASDLRALIGTELARRIRTAPLPAGRLARQSVRIDAGGDLAAGGTRAVAVAVARGVVRAIEGPGRG